MAELLAGGLKSKLEVLMVYIVLGGSAAAEAETESL